MQEPHEVPIGESQLFLDDCLIHSKEKVTRIWHRLQKHPANPIMLRSDREENIFLFGTVIRDVDPLLEKEVFRMWYFAWGLNTQWIAYARSNDGLRWEKPDIGIGDRDADQPRNAVFINPDWRLIGLSGVLKDPLKGGYKLMIPAADAETNDKTYLMAESRDGLEWKIVSTFTPEPPCNPDRACFTWDPKEKCYLLYNRAKHADQDLKERGGPAYWGRAIALCTSRDFRTWSPPKMVVHAETNEPDGTELYGMAAYPYQGEWIGLVQVFRSLPRLAYIDLAIAYSRDGRNWDRERELVLPRGGVGEWDRFNQCASTQLVRVGDRLWVYYSGRLYRHGEYEKFTALKDTGPRQVGIGLATIRVDGWCSMRASFDSGQITTIPLVLPEKVTMCLNAKSRWGDIVVEVLDENQNEIPGLKSRSIRDDAIRIPVIWEENNAWHGLLGEQMRIRFKMRNAELYSWSIKPERV